MNRRCLRWLWILLATVLLAGYAEANGAKGMARAHLEPAGQVMPGQPVKLVVDALTTNWFTAAPVFPPLDIPGAIVSPPSDDASNLNDMINGEKWFGVTRSYLITPQTGGDLAIPPITLTLQIGQVSGTVQVHTPPLKLSVKTVQRPAGAENAIGTTRLQITQTLDHAMAGLRQGDAFTRTIQISADGVPGMMLPVTTFAAVPGLAVYPKAATVHDISKDREGFLGSTRTDAATYVAQKAGDYVLPGITVQWWDTRANQLRTAQIPELRFSVAANAAYQPALGLPPEASAPVAAPVRHINVRLVASMALMVGVAVLLAWLLLPRLWWGARRVGAWRRQRQLAWQASEAAAWQRLRHALHGQDVSAILTSLYAWLQRTAWAGDGPQINTALDKPGAQFLRDIYGIVAPARPDVGALRKVITRLHSSRTAVARIDSPHQGQTGLRQTLNPRR